MTSRKGAKRKRETSLSLPFSGKEPRARKREGSLKKGRAGSRPNLGGLAEETNGGVCPFPPPTSPLTCLKGRSQCRTVNKSKAGDWLSGPGSVGLHPLNEAIRGAFL